MSIYVGVIENQGVNMENNNRREATETIDLTYKHQD